MADRIINDEQLREMATADPLALAICASLGLPACCGSLADAAKQLTDERDAARAQLHADDQRAWEALGRPEGTHETTNVQRLCAEVERLRADLREAMALLRAYCKDRQNITDWRPIWERAFELVEKHKETP